MSGYNTFEKNVNIILEDYKDVINKTAEFFGSKSSLATSTFDFNKRYFIKLRGTGGLTSKSINDALSSFNITRKDVNSINFKKHYNLQREKIQNQYQFLTLVQKSTINVNIPDASTFLNNFYRLLYTDTSSGTPQGVSINEVLIGKKQPVNFSVVVLPPEITPDGEEKYKFFIQHNDVKKEDSRTSLSLSKEQILEYLNTLININESGKKIVIDVLESRTPKSEVFKAGGNVLTISKVNSDSDVNSKLVTSTRQINTSSNIYDINQLKYIHNLIMKYFSDKIFYGTREQYDSTKQGTLYKAAQKLGKSVWQSAAALPKTQV